MAGTAEETEEVVKGAEMVVGAMAGVRVEARVEGVMAKVEVARVEVAMAKVEVAKVEVAKTVGVDKAVPTQIV